VKFLKLISILFFLQGCSSNYEWGWYILSPDNIDGLTNLKFLISGITTTIYISVVSIILAMIIGLIVALPSLSNNKFLTYFNITYVEIVRAIPLLVLILWIYYGLPIMIGVSFSPFVSGIIALTISESAFQAEIFRAGETDKGTVYLVGGDMGVEGRLSTIDDGMLIIYSGFCSIGFG